MKVPEKILITQDEDTKELSEHWCLRNLTNNPHIEYTRTDAFIEKACEFWTKNQRGFVTYKDIVDFKNFMKGG